MTKSQGLSGAQLKWIALVSMLLDHIGLTLVYMGYVLAHRVDRSAAAMPLYWTLRAVGRLAFPLYCFLLAEGAAHTRSRGRYLLRLFSFALLSEIPFDLAFRRVWLEFGHQNVYFTLALGLLAVFAMEELRQGSAPRGRRLLCALTALAAPALAWALKTDYGAPGVLLIAVLCQLRERPPLRALGGTAVLALMIPLGSHWIEILGAAAFFPIGRYNGRRGRQPKLLFYLFYPAHLLLLAGLRALIWGL